MTKIWAIVPAAGSGSRLQSDLPKQYLQVRGKAILALALQRLLAVDTIEGIVVALAAADSNWKQLQLQDDRIRTCSGGALRQDSVLNGLRRLGDEAADDDWVLVHDAARPCVRTADIEKLIASLWEHDVGGLLGWPVDNTLKRVAGAGAVVETIDRDNCWNAATPQMFRLGMLRQALSQSTEQGQTFTDEAAAIQAMGYTPLMVGGSRDNIKITHEQDLFLAESILQRQETEP
ncbi:MAG: 2-C-methyl-D-erythritol 4-phosphate cytidylyltransferase [Gammaproteobacteria bacterium]